MVPDSPPSSPPETRRRGPTRGVALLTAALLALGAWGADQLTKLWVENAMRLGERIDVLPPVLYWQYHLNPGAAFSMGTDHTWFFTAVMVAVLLFILWNSRKLGGSWWWTLGFGGLAGGVAGNLTDRIFRAPSREDGSFSEFAQGHVVDFIAVPRFAIFNVADSFIVCSILGLCLLMLLGRHIDGTTDRSRASAPEQPAGEGRPE